MRTLFSCLLALVIFGSARAGEPGHVFKVLPLLLDQQGRAATSPSLFDRDAYQLYLRNHTNEISAVRYDILWNVKKSEAANCRLRLELRAVAADGKPKLKTLESPVTPGIFRKWNSITLEEADLKNLGSIVAWRATLWNGSALIGEQKSFLW